MPKFGAVSRANLAELHPKLRQVYEGVIQWWDCAIIDGKRTVEEQRRNVARGVSKTMASKHLPDADGFSRAADVMPFPFDWGKIEKGLQAIKRADGGMEIAEVYMFQGFVAGYAAALGIDLRQGADWDSDRQFEDQTFIDLPHSELR